MYNLIRLDICAQPWDDPISENSEHSQHTLPPVPAPGAQVIMNPPSVTESFTFPLFYISGITIYVV